eukprot:CAMPEP_0202107930 /NCGR_PEP_ID=MMETSP0965-20130614/18671_1 /ASSEMBLY_ACC=CAM_ASM_000507 /TAXON_ID=4773 /ORGANISM="Schizochytrium aggregatum, Strain ATCC28209" /LENGTH=54 /DNA_ID=CAMNT_0048677127 /DNA_START=244 /DNA_END=404 /DNA_ORIENTATION=-
MAPRAISEQRDHGPTRSSLYSSCAIKLCDMGSNATTGQLGSSLKSSCTMDVEMR